MPLNIRSDEGKLLAEALAGHTEAVKLTLEDELRRPDAAVPLRERIRPLQRRVMARPPTGLEADKVFYDTLSEEA